MPSLTFLGAAGTVTGSKYLIDTGDHRVLVDCGLFQGLKALRLRNWQPLPLAATSIDAVILTHAHLDHCGYLPRLVSEGFKGRVFCTPGTKDLCSLVLPDSARIQEGDIDWINRHRNAVSHFHVLGVALLGGDVMAGVCAHSGRWEWRCERPALPHRLRG